MANQTRDAFGPLTVVRDGSTGAQLAITNKEGTVVAGPDARYTAAQLSALAAAGGLTPYAEYVLRNSALAVRATDSQQLRQRVEPLEAFQLGYNAVGGEAIADFVSGSWAFVASGAGGGSWSTASPLLFGRAAVLQPEAVNGANARVKLAGSWTVDSSDTFLVVTDSHTAVENNAQIRLAFSSDGLSAKSAYAAHVVKIAHGTRAYFMVRASDFTLGGGESLSNTMNYLEVRYTSGTAGGGSVRVLGVYRNTKAKAKILIDFDDGKASVYSYAWPIMAKYGLIGNMAIIPADLGTANYMTVAQVGELYDVGWDVLTHGETGHTALASRAAVLADILANKNAIAARGWTRNDCHLHYVYPGGLVSPPANNDSVGCLAEAGMLSSRLVDPNVQPTNHLGIDCAYGLWSREISATTTLATLLSDIDRAIECGGTVRIHGHNIVKTVVTPGTDFLISEFDSLCSGIADRISLGKLAAMRMTDWWANVAVVGT